VRYGRPGAKKPAAIDGDGKLRDLSKVIEDVTKGGFHAFRWFSLPESDELPETGR
jgi:hypothetical protein